jgi:hypothetical protein
MSKRIKTNTYLFDHGHPLQIHQTSPTKVQGIEEKISKDSEETHGRPDISSQIGGAWKVRIRHVTNVLVHAFAAFTPLTSQLTEASSSQENDRICFLLGYFKFLCKPSPRHPNNKNFKKVEHQPGITNKLLVAARENIRVMLVAEDKLEDFKSADGIMSLASSSTLNQKFADTLHHEFGIPLKASTGTYKKTCRQLSREIILGMRKNPSAVLNCQFSLQPDTIRWLAIDSKYNTKKWLTKKLQNVLSPEQYQEMLNRFGADEVRKIDNMTYQDSWGIQLLRWANENRNNTHKVSLNRESGLSAALITHLKLSIFKVTPSMRNLVLKSKRLVIVEDDIRHSTSLHLIAQTLTAINPDLEILFIAVFDGRPGRANVAKKSVNDMLRNPSWKDTANLPQSRSLEVSQLRSLIRSATNPNPPKTTIIHHQKATSFNGFISGHRSYLKQHFIYEEFEKDWFRVHIGTPNERSKPLRSFLKLQRHQSKLLV